MGKMSQIANGTLKLTEEDEKEKGATKTTSASNGLSLSDIASGKAKITSAVSQNASTKPKTSSTTSKTTNTTTTRTGQTVNGVELPERFKTITDRNAEDYAQWVYGQMVENSWTDEQLAAALGSSKKNATPQTSAKAETQQPRRATPEGGRPLETIQSELEAAKTELNNARVAARGSTYRPRGNNEAHNAARGAVSDARNKVKALEKELEDTYGFKGTTLENMLSSQAEKTKSNLSAIGGLLLDVGGVVDQSASSDTRRVENARQNIETYTKNRDAAATQEERDRWQKLIDHAQNEIKAYTRSSEIKQQPMQDATQKLYEASNEQAKKAEQYREGALDGKSDIEQAAVNVGMFLGDVGSKVGMNAILPGAGTFAFGVDAAGQSIREYRQTKGNAQGYAADQQIGQYGLGNIDLYNRPIYHNEDGSISTVESITIEENGQYILLPTVAYDDKGNAKKLTDKQAVDRYHKTGEMLGAFTSEAAAEQYAEQLHLAQEFRYASEYNPMKALARGALSAAGVAVGAKMSTAANNAALKFLRSKGIQNLVAPNIGVGGLSGLGFATGTTALNELGKAVTDTSYTPDWKQIGATELSGFAFGALSRLVSIAAVSGQNKAAMRSELDELQRRYEYAKSVIDNPGVAAADKARGAQSVMDAVDGMSARLDELYVVGAQKEVDAARAFLSEMKAEMQPYTTAPGAAGVGAGAQAMVPFGGGSTLKTEAPAQATGQNGTINALPAPQAEQSEAPRIVAPTAEQEGLMLPTARERMQAQPDGFDAQTGDQTMNGGTENGGQQNYLADGGQRSGIADSAAAADAVPDGIGGRLADERTAGQAGSVGQGGPQRAAEQSRTILERQAAGRNLRKVSTRELGIDIGTENAAVAVMPEQMWDDEMRSLAQEVRQETGKNVTYVLGRMQVTKSDGSVAHPRGAWTADGIIIQADNFGASVTQIGRHEMFHDYVEQDPGVLRAVENAIREQYTDGELDKVLDRYISRLRGIIDVDESMTQDEVDAAYDDLKNEVFADAYAEINAFGAHADRFSDTVRETAQQRGFALPRENAAATDRRTGPPADGRFSIDKTREKTIKDQLKDYRAGRMSRYDEFYYGTTPRALGEAGLDELPLVLSQSDYKKSTSQKHSVPNRATTRLAELVGDPILAWENGDEVGILTKDIDANGKPLLVGIRKNVTLDNEPVNRIKSAYGLDNPQAWMNNQRRNGGTLHVFDKSRAASYLNDADDVIGRTGTNRSAERIAEDEPEVKSGIFDDVPRAELPTAADDTRTDYHISYSVDEYSDAEKAQHAKDVVEYFGRTYNWNETGYLTQDGTRVDFSGKHDGGPGGYRTVDHREITDALGVDYGGDDYSGAMVQFMSEGNIRIMPETNGINLQIEPTEQQYDQLERFIQRAHGEVMVDFDDAQGNTVDSREYDEGTRASRVLDDIRAYFRTGAAPQQSDVARFHTMYSIDETDSTGRTLTDAQRGYFAQSKIVDGDGHLLLMYHGTTNYGEITKFRRGSKGWLGPGIYITSRLSDAQRYADAMGPGNGTVYELYANVTNPLVVTGSNPVPEILRAIYGRDTVYSSRSAKQANDPNIITSADIKKLQSKGYDGIRWNFGNSTEVSVFSPEQVKRADNESPTDNSDIRFSFGGENAHGADLDALQTAKEMKAADVDDETIRQETGWFTGADGKWRFEIDDSGMEYRPGGDANFRSAHPDYAEYWQLLNRMLSGEMLPAEDEERLQELDSIWGREYGRLHERVGRGAAVLSDIIQHDELFSNYPQLRKARVVFMDMPDGARGEYHRGENTIVLSNRLRAAPEDTLIHEVQHAIQEAEDFTQGASVDSWEDRLTKERRREVEAANAKVREVFDSMPEEVQNMVREMNRATTEKDYDRANDIERELLESEYSDLYTAYTDADWDRQTVRERMKHADLREEAYRMYQNTAGEIEARDAARRRTWSTEERKRIRPYTGDENTVFADDTDEAYRVSRSIDDTSELVERYMDDGTGGESIFKNGWERRNPELMESIVRNRPQTKTDAFREWFGKSKAVNAEDEPLLVFHGTDKRFTKFKSGKPIWFSANPMYAVEYSGYQSRAENLLPGAEVYGGAEDKLMPAYIRAENPADFGITDIAFEPNVQTLAARTGIRPGALLDVWESAGKKTAAWETINTPEMVELLKKEGFDSIKAIENGTNTWAVFDSSQAKSAVANNGRFDRTKADVRYSVDDRIPQSSAEYARMKRDGDIEEEKRQKPQKPVRESLPVIAKRDLRQNLLNLFSIPAGQRNELGNVIERYADRMLNDGRLTQRDMDDFFDRMYAEGVISVEADDFYQEARSAIAGRRIYVNETTKGDFGDDWNAFRKRAFAAGVYLTNDRADPGVDVVNAELADRMPGAFDDTSADMRDALERVVQLAEEGKDEKMSLAEYTAMLARQEYVSEDEVLDNMERQMDWALRTFAEKAKLEVTLRDRTGTKIAQERERAGESAERERAREAARRAKERDRRKELAQRQRENRELRELQNKTLKQLQWLNKNRYRAPGELKKAWDEVLGDIDIYAASAADETRWSKKYNATWRDIADMYKKAKETDPNFLPSKELDRIVMRLDGDKIEDMDLAALQDLYKAAVGLRTEFYNRNNVINDEEGRMFAEVYADAKRELAEGTKKVRDEFDEEEIKRGRLDAWLNDLQLTPMNTLERMAGWNPNSQWYSMAKQLEEGERAARRFKTEAQNALADFLTENQEWVKKADGQGKDAIWYELEVPELMELGMGDKPIFGKAVKVYMTPAQKVHMYLESKSYDNLRHMAGGRTFPNRKLYSEGERAEAFAQGKTVRLAPETVKKIVSNLTPEEQALADALDKFYNGYAKENINRVSNALYGYDKALGKNYAPIYTNKNYVKSELGIFDITAEGVGNLKQRQYSSNPSYNIGAFDAFERSVDRTSRFVGMAIPARNWNTLMDWREKNDSMRDVVTHEWGKSYADYIDKLLVELQQGKENNAGRIDKATNAILSRYISAVFGFNPSIVFKQFASYPLAAAYLGWENMPVNIPKTQRVDDRLINAYTGELGYRLLGYSTPETAQLKNNPGRLEERGPLNFLFGGGAITWMDGMTVKAMWSWAENKVRRERPELAVGPSESIMSGKSPFYQEVARVFEEAVSRSQPMYDVMHRSNVMRESGALTRTFNLFKTVPQQEYNMLRQAVGEARWHKENGSDEETRREANKKAGRAVLGVLVGNLMLGTITFLNAMLTNKGKKYRNEDGDIDIEALMQNVGKQYFADSAGLVIGGNVLAEMLGSILAGDKWYDIRVPGGEQLEEILEGVIDAGKTMTGLVKDSIDVARSGGNWLQYMKDNRSDYISAVHDAAIVLAKYVGRIPAGNVEKYLLGAMSWLWPQGHAAIEDFMEGTGKSSLKGLNGGALETRTGNILKDRAGNVSKDAIEEIARLYDGGYTDAVPADQQKKLTVNGEERELNIAQQQTYKNVWKAAVGNALDEMVGSRDFAAADDETRAKMLKRLYDYATDKAKEALFDDYEAKSSTEKADAAIAGGASLTEAAQMQQSGEIDYYMKWQESDARKEGVASDIYIDFKMTTKDFTADKDEDGKSISGSKKEKVLDYIDGLPLTLAQKDALYYDAGYKESAIDDAPWNDNHRGITLPR